MKGFLIPLICLIIAMQANNLAAQNAMNQTDKVIKSQSEKINAWIELINANSKNNIKQAGIIVDSLIQISKSAAQDTAFVKVVDQLQVPLVNSLQYNLLNNISIWLTKVYTDNGNDQRLLNANYYLGISLMFTNRQLEAKKIFLKCLEDVKTIDLKKPEHFKLKTLVKLGVTHGMMAESSEAIHYFLSSDSLANVLGDKKMGAAIASFMSNIYHSLNQFEQAIEMAEKAKNLSIELGNLSTAISSCLSLSNSYKSLDKYQEALDVLAEGRRYGKKLGKTSLLNNYLNTGQVYILLEQNQTAQKWLDTAYQISLELNNELGRNKVLGQMAVLNQNMGNYQKAIAIGHKRLELAQHLTNKRPLQDTYFDLWQAYKGLGNIDSIHFYASWFWHLRDSIRKHNFTAQSAQLQTQFQTETQRNKIASLEADALLAKEREAQKDFFNQVLLVGIIAAIIVLIALIYFFNKIKKSKKEIADKNAKLAESDKQKATLLKELHHRVKNNLQIVSSLLNLQRASVKDVKAKAAFKEGQHRVDAMAMIHRHLYTTDELTSVHINTYLGRLIQSLAYSYGFNKANFELSSDITTEPVDVDIAIPLGLIVNELVSNTFKHAFNEVEKAKISIKLQLEGEFIQLEIKDNGKGIPKDFSMEESSSFGLDLVHTLVSQLKGKINFRNQDGAIFTIQINRNKTMAA